MKIWIDFINSPQVSFWVPFIDELKRENHEILLTCRDSGNTIELLKQQNLNYQIIGERVGKSTMQKLLFFPKRLIKLYSYIRKEKPDIAASQSSFYQPLVARTLSIPCLYTNDNEHAKGNLFGFLFAKKIMLPVALKNEVFTTKWPQNSKISFYPSVKEAIYLSQQPELVTLISNKKDTIYFRPEPWSAQYYDGPLNFFDDMLLALSSEYRIIVLPRDKNQAEHYSQNKFKALNVPAKPLQLKNIVSDCLLFIGAGGSMTRELAVLGVPVVSIYQAKSLCVDKYLVEKGQMKINPDVTYSEIKSILTNSRNVEKNYSTLNEGKISYNLIKNTIVNLKYEQN
jgi:predicted glycosyltransferase